MVAYLIDSQDDENFLEDSQTILESQIEPVPKNLKLKIFPPPQNDEKPYVVHCKIEQKGLNIGRSPKCYVKLEDQLISKVQSTIKYVEGNWILEDGRDGKKSINGTWYYLSEE